MTQNPYAAGGYEAEIHTEPERTSLAAIFSLICSITCCLALPGVILGIVALIGIGGSNGRVGGKGLAIAGIILGTLFTALQIGGGLAINTGVKAAVRQGQIAGQVLVDIENGDYDSARSVFGGAVTNMADEDLQAFHDAYTADAGAYVSSPQTGWEYAGAFGQAGQLMQQVQGRNDAVPFPTTFANGEGIVLLIIDQTRTTPPPAGQFMPMIDLIVLAPSGNKYVMSDYQTTSRLPAPADADQDADTDEQAPEGDELPGEG